ncbi:MAG TPA: DNA gyrase subunit A, partial [Gammaproteobacteria bacterium]|nr:DNA gyrase subunit A [Gammaproteobacteria bacterium]
MVESTQDISSINIENELKQSYLDYAMSVIVGRALPDVRDGLKPVHRRVLFAMKELGNDWNKAYKKSARVVGDVIGKYHPHGDSAVYDTIVRMAQPFSMRYMLVDGQGNFGSIDGDNAAAMRYTEVRMKKLAHELLADLDKNTVDFVPNYDGTEMMPSVMPTKVPNLLINGTSGIAVGMATNIPPHNLTEVVSACIALLDNPELTVDDLMEYVKGPDFPTAAIINGRAGIVQAYRTGRGRVLMRARYHIETTERSGRETVVFTEIPYQLNKAKLVERIAELVKEKKIEGIAELRDESDKDGIRIVLELKKGENAEVLANNLYSQTQLESAFGVNMVALVDGKPQLVNLKTILKEFLKHRRRVVTRRTVYLLQKARERGHILEGLAVALSNIDPVIALIKASPSSADAKEQLMSQAWAPGDVLEMLERAGGEEDLCRPDDLPAGLGFVDGKYHLSERQAQAILDLRLQKLTGMEQHKLLAEYQEKLEEMRALALILTNPERLVEVIREELEEIKSEYGDDRRSEISASQHDLSVEDLIDDEPMVVTISEEGYAKAQSLSTYQAQRRGGRGKIAASFKEDDSVKHLIVANMLDTILCFTDNGKCYWLKVYQLPQGGRSARGRPLVNIISIAQDERVTSLLPIRDFPEDRYVFMAT